MCKLQWKPVFNIEAVKTCMKWGAYMCGEHVRKRVKFVRTCCKAPTCSCFVSLSKSNMSQPAQRDFWWKKTAGDCWWSNVYHHEMKPVPNQLGPVQPISERHLKLWQSSPQSWFTKMVNFTNGSGKDLEIDRRDHKMFLGKTMGKFHLSEMNQFFQVFQTLSFLLYQDLCKRSLVQNIQFDPLKTHVKWTVSKTSWKIHLNFLVGEMGSPSS